MVTIEVTPTVSKIVGVIPPKHFVPLRHALSYEIPNQFFRKQNNRFAKDRAYLLTEKRQEFRTGLLSRVISLCEQIGIDYEIKDHRIQGEPDHFMPLRLESTMRDYQTEAIETALREKTGLVRLATGGGKTRIMAGIVAALERRAIILVHRLDLLVQVERVLHDLLLFPEVIGRVGGGVYQPNLITACTVQTLCAALGLNYDDSEDPGDEEDLRGAQVFRSEIEAMLTSAQVVIVDECHRVGAKSIYEFLKKIPNATWRLGMTATDWREDNGDLLIEAALGPRIFNYTLSDMVNDGWLVPASVIMAPMRRSSMCDSDNWNTLYSHYYTNNDVFHDQVTAVNKDWHNQGRHILTLVTHVKHGEILKRRHEEFGIPTAFLSGRDSQSVRDEVLKDVRSGKLRHLIGTSIADEGLDLPILDALNLAGGGKSRLKVFQRIGRTLRLYPGKDRAYVMDYRCKEESTLNEHAGRRAQIYRTESALDFQEIKSR